MTEINSHGRILRWGLRGSVGLLVLVLSLLSSPHPDQESDRYPQRPIKLIVPFSPGGGTDTFGRVIKKAIEDNELLPQPLVIINLDGAGGTIGSRRAKDAKPDGYTVLLLHEAILTAKYSGNVPYGPEAFEPIAGTGRMGLVVAVREDSPYQTLGELVDEAARRPDEVVFAANLGAPVHFVGLRVEQHRPEARFLFTQTGGGTKRLHAVKGGHADVTAFSIEEFLRYESAGIRALAYCDEQRHPSLPDTLTTHEQGFPVTHINMQFWWMPKNAPAARIERIADALAQAMQTEYVRDRMAKIHCDPVVVRGAEMKREIEMRQDVIAQVDLRPTIPLPNVPLLTFAVVAILGGVVAVRSRPLVRSEKIAQLRYGLVLQVLLVTAAYAAVLSWNWLGFIPATILFLFLVGDSLAGKSLQRSVIVAAIAVFLPFVLYWLFHGVFDLILPGKESGVPWM